MYVIELRELTFSDCYELSGENLEETYVFPAGAER